MLAQLKMKTDIEFYITSGITAGLKTQSGACTSLRQVLKLTFSSFLKGGICSRGSALP